MEFLSWHSGSIPGLAQWVAVSCGVGCRHSSDLMWLWLWCRSAAIAPIWPLAWKPPCAVGVALKKTKNKQTNQKKNQLTWSWRTLYFLEPENWLIFLLFIPFPEYISLSLLNSLCYWIFAKGFSKILLNYIPSFPFSDLLHYILGIFWFLM